MGNKRDTHTGFRDPDDPERIPTAPRSPVAGLGESFDDQTEVNPAGTTPGPIPFDVDVTREIGAPGLLDGPWVAVELWTQNRIYGLGGGLLCIRVRDRHTGQDAPQHPTRGARLAGGQRRSKAGLITEVSHPLPEVGSNAVFVTGMGNRLRVSETSSVTRVLMRQRIVTVGPNGELPTWDEITDSGAHKSPR